MVFLHLLFQIPAIFTACAALYYALPFKLPARMLPLYMVVVSFLVMMLPVHYCLALGVAGLVLVLYNVLGVDLASEDAPDMRAVWDNAVAAYAWASERLPLPGKHVVYDHSEDGHEDPPHPPDGVVTSRIPPLPG